MKDLAQHGAFDFQRDKNAPAANRTRGPSMATMDFTTKPLALVNEKGPLVNSYKPGQIGLTIRPLYSITLRQHNPTSYVPARNEEMSEDYGLLATHKSPSMEACSHCVGRIIHKIGY